jgi:hypothetical protein
MVLNLITYTLLLHTALWYCFLIALRNLLMKYFSLSVSIFAEITNSSYSPDFYLLVAYFPCFSFPLLCLYSFPASPFRNMGWQGMGWRSLWAAMESQSQPHPHLPVGLPALQQTPCGLCWHHFLNYSLGLLSLDLTRAWIVILSYCSYNGGHIFSSQNVPFFSPHVALFEYSASRSLHWVLWEDPKPRREIRYVYKHLNTCYKVNSTLRVIELKALYFKRWHPMIKGRILLPLCSICFFYQARLPVAELETH